MQPRGQRLYSLAALSLLLALPPVQHVSADAMTPRWGLEQIRASRSGVPDSMDSYLRSQQLQSVLGLQVRTRGEENIGRIIDVLANRSGEVQAAVIEFGGFLGIGTRKIAVEWSALSFDIGGDQPVAVLDMTRDQVRLAPEYKANHPAVVLRSESS